MARPAEAAAAAAASGAACNKTVKIAIMNVYLYLITNLSYTN
jgi:hypothetical protein